METWIPPMPGVTPTPPKLKSTAGTVATGQSSMPKPALGHFAPANWVEASHAAV